MNQRSFASAEFAMKKKRTRRTQHEAVVGRLLHDQRAACGIEVEGLGAGAKPDAHGERGIGAIAGI